jgi:hypothetical protein
VGYYVNNFYEELELIENPPSKPVIEKLTRHILIEKPRVTKFQIEWEDETTNLEQENNPSASNMEAPSQEELAKMGIK